MLTIYKASAGSGKTFSLAYEYIKLLLGVKRKSDGVYRLNHSRYLNGAGALASRHRHILAITFTNKATEEMKSRIVKELGKIVSAPADDDSKYARKLVGDFGCSRDELREVAARALRDLLFDYHHFNVSTIDSFFQTVLRAFARDVDRQGDYGIELRDEYAVSAGISLMLDDLNYGNPAKRVEIMRWIRDFTMQQIDDGNDSSFFNRSGKILSELAEYVKSMSSERFKTASQDVIRYLSDPGRLKTFVTALDSRIQFHKSAIIARASALVASLQSDGINYPSLKSPIPKLIEAGLSGEIPESKLFKGALVTSLLGDLSDFKPTSLFLKDEFQDNPRCASHIETISDWVKDLRRNIAAISSIETVRNACPNLEFLGFAWDYVRRFREENNLILLSDTQDLLNRIIAGSETPFIYERIGTFLSHFLIDEFQDTSVMQWENLKPLLANSLAAGDDSLIIGDEKQSIYRFRNSDPSLLHHVVEEIDFPEKSKVKQGPSHNTNYRSAPGIVTFNNALFTRIAGSLNVPGYENTIQSLPEDDQEPLSSYIKIYDTTAIPDGDDPAELEITAREIIRQHEAGYRWSDIAVLVRFNSQTVRISEYLLKNYPEINIISAEGLLLKNSPAVKLIIGMLKLVDKSYSDAGRAELTADAPRYGTDGDIRLIISRYDYFRSQNHEPAQALRLALLDDAEVSRLIDSSVGDIRSEHPLDLVSLVETIIAKRVNDRVSDFAFIAAFQDELIKYCSIYNPSVHEFLKWWDENSDKLAVSPGAGQDAVTIMTIHKAKGLESECIIIPYGDWPLYKVDEQLWVDLKSFDFIPKTDRPPLISITNNPNCLLDGSLLQHDTVTNRNAQIADCLNTLYVAYTRPKRELIICLPLPKEKKTSSKNDSAPNSVAARVAEALRVPSASHPDSDTCMHLSDYLVKDDPDGVIFCYGDPTTPVKPKTEKSDKEDDSPEPLVLEDYITVFRSKSDTLSAIDTFAADETEIPDDDVITGQSPDTPSLFDNDDARNAAAERGTRLHSILGDISSVSDIDAVVSRAAMRYGLDDETAQSYREIVAAAFDNAAAYTARWFSPDAKVYSEQSIYIPERDETYRPDRIVMYADGSADIVDYKFTSEPQPSHGEQVRFYCNVLRSMGYGRVTGYLWYPELNIVKTVKK